MNWYDTHRIHGAAIYGAPWIPSIYPSHVSIYTSTMDPSWDMIWYLLISIFFGRPTGTTHLLHIPEKRPSAILIKRVTVRIKTSFKMSYPETRWFIKTNFSFNTSPEHRPSSNLRILMHHEAPSRKWFPWTSRNLAPPEAQAECSECSPGDGQGWSWSEKNFRNMFHCVKVCQIVVCM